jgi:hypothetical protein
MYRLPDIDATYCFVRSFHGDYAVQVVHENGHFMILTDDQSFTRGLGWAASWAVVPAREVPKEIRRALRYALENYVDYVLTCE